ncbi:hypothetical protein EVAR_29224_1 [Eumeta japonica]|uniref:Uncharacterized protein n=1 Tax=Eumeta variegata TaxID=151549 RepID=A0A4C1VI76_EUMVA|nr:hypothetical protein EVAR_29224_1 [Eumeta japonica]
MHCPRYSAPGPSPGGRRRSKKPIFPGRGSARPVYWRASPAPGAPRLATDVIRFPSTYLENHRHVGIRIGTERTSCAAGVGLEESPPLTPP